METGQRIKDRRKQRDMSQKELAALAGVRQTAISNYELGIREPSFRVLWDICKALEVSADELIAPNSN